MWAAGELFGLLVAGAVVAQWMRHAEREARRADRRLDEALVPA
jgi:putative membrane protein